MTSAFFDEEKFRLFIYEGNSNNEIKYYNRKHKKIDNPQILFSGMSGSGKSVHLERWIANLIKEGYTVIVITEKENHEFESAFAMFPVKSKYHLDILNAKGIKPMEKDKLRDFVRIYHPFTFNIPDTPLPTMQFYTLPIKGISEQGFSSLLVGSEDSKRVRQCYSASKILSDRENLWDFLERVCTKDEDRKEKKFNYNRREMLIQIPTSKDKADISEAKESFMPFREDFYLHSSHSKYNLKMEKIINDNKRLHIFSKKWITDKRQKFFINITLLEEIERCISAGIAKNPIAVVIEEIMQQLPPKPASERLSYEKSYITSLVRILLTIRQAGMVMITTQKYSETVRQIRSACNLKMIGKTSMEDKHKFLEDFNFKTAQIDLISSLNVGEFVIADDILKGDRLRYKAIPPPFAHCDNENFIKRYSEEYPDMLKDYKPLKTEMLDMRNAIEEERIKKLMAIEEKENEKSDKKQQELVKEKKKSQLMEDALKQKDKESIKKACYDMRKIKNEKGEYIHSFRAIGRELNLSGTTARRYAKDYANQIADAVYLGDSKNL